MQRAVLRIVQEALANVHRHASATHVSIDLRRLAGRLYLTITDNGQGVEGMSEDGGRALLRPGVGVRGIRARVRQFGGDLKVQSGSHGTRIHAVVPIHQASNAEKRSPWSRSPRTPKTKG
jgi:signal transduction histidine kinase